MLAQPTVNGALRSPFMHLDAAMAGALAVRPKAATTAAIPSRRPTRPLTMLIPPVPARPATGPGAILGGAFTSCRPPPPPTPGALEHVPALCQCAVR